jgi:hypothetical protein
MPAQGIPTVHSILVEATGCIGRCVSRESHGSQQVVVRQHTAVSENVDVNDVPLHPSQCFAVLQQLSIRMLM